KIRRSTRKRKTSGRLEDHDDRHKQKRRPTQSSSTRPKAPSPPPMAPITQSRTPSVHHICSPPLLPPRDPTAPPMAPIQPPSDMGHQCLSIEQEKIRRSTRKRKTPGRLEDHNDRHKQKRRPTQRSFTRPRTPSSPPMAPIRPSRTPSVATKPPMPPTPPCSPPQLPPRDPTPPPMAPIQPPADIRQEWLSKEQGNVQHILSVKSMLGEFGSQNIKEKIIQRQYLDMTKLLPSYYKNTIPQDEKGA
ncbi:uncharacterized protein LOC132713664, partial [Ruditapes philippinarum]|uniref:uncharacterized protein LOC132713664 n=1 Tax=Ruditapes philippinarum TaxID=129788 RepID=UPI00295B6A82